MAATAQAVKTTFAPARGFITPFAISSKGPQYYEKDTGYETPCWIWQRTIDNKGYARVRLNSKYRLAHRVAYETFVGNLPSNNDLHHKCGRTDCVNPAHMEVLTRGEHNSLRVDRNEIMKLLEQGLSQAEIAKRLNCAAKTVREVQRGHST